MKILFFVLLNVITVSCICQVGLLSSNNKNESNKTTDIDTNNLKLSPIINSYVNSSIANLPDTSNVKVAIEETGRVNELREKLNNLSNKLERNQTLINQLKFQTKSNKESKKELLDRKIETESLLNQISALNNVINGKKRSDSLLVTLIKLNYVNAFNNFTVKLGILLSATKDFEKAINKSNFLTRHYPVDTSEKIIEFDKFTREMAEVYSVLTILDKSNNKTEIKIEEILDKVISTNLPDTIKDPVKVNVNLENKWKSLAIDTTNLSKQFREDTSTYNAISSSYEKVLRDYVIKRKEKVNTDTKTTNFGAFPQLTSILGKKEVIPQLQLIGTYNTEKSTKSFEANLGLSFAPSATPDTSNLYSIFIPSSSKFLIHSNFTWSFLPVGTNQNNDSAKKVGIRLDVSFASKNLLFDTVKTSKIVSSSILYAKCGIELGVLPKRLSIYGNVNTATLLDKIDEFRSGTGIDSKFFGYIDCGTKLYLDPTPNSKVPNDLFIYSNLNFIINSGDVKRVARSNDLVIPSIQVGIVKTLGKF